ncbi:MAG: hypothetical protein MUC59_13950, partial [Saprospiraceae bacterium]|nr:hypothetical protein [Saprospiraceae bacterium]
QGFLTPRWSSSKKIFRRNPLGVLSKNKEQLPDLHTCLNIKPLRGYSNFNSCLKIFLIGKYPSVY